MARQIANMLPERFLCAEQAMAVLAGYRHCELFRRSMTSTLDARQPKRCYCAASRTALEVQLVAHDSVAFKLLDVVYG